MTDQKTVLKSVNIQLPYITDKMKKEILFITNHKSSSKNSRQGFSPGIHSNITLKQSAKPSSILKTDKHSQSSNVLQRAPYGSSKKFLSLNSLELNNYACHLLGINTKSTDPVNGITIRCLNRTAANSPVIDSNSSSLYTLQSNPNRKSQLMSPEIVQEKEKIRLLLKEDPKKTDLNLKSKQKPEFKLSTRVISFENSEVTRPREAFKKFINRSKKIHSIKPLLNHEQVLLLKESSSLSINKLSKVRDDGKAKE